jgi:SAM-dependent methyltransferase
MADTEICGDGRMRPLDRLRYLLLNARRNMFAGNTLLRAAPFCAPRTMLTAGDVSPGRALTEAFLLQQLPKLLPPGPIRVLDIGCGQGHLPQLLAAAGYSGEYVGLDIDDRFDRAFSAPGFSRSFVRGDAHAFKSDSAFELIISISALEHIPDDAALIRRLPDLLTPRGLQLHIVPAGWALPSYLWHGYRQYTLPSLERRFGSKGVAVYALGGLAGLLLHIVMITLPELLLRLPMRRWLPNAYRAMLDAALRADQRLAVAASFHAITRRNIAEPGISQ